MSHHYSGPDWAFPRGDARLDLADLYAFPKPDDASKSIFVMNVHPSYGGPTSNTPFAPEALYELKIDSDGDSVADIAYRVRFSRSQSGSQAATSFRAEGRDARAAGDEGQKIVEHAPISMGWKRGSPRAVTIGFLPNGAAIRFSLTDSVHPHASITQN
jgi:uncharacterized protein DUF4331